MPNVAKLSRISLVGVLLPLALASALSSCNETGTDPITVINRSQEPLQIWGTGARGELVMVVMELDPGSQDILLEECIGLAAVRGDGTEAGRIRLICQGDPPWVINDQAG